MIDALNGLLDLIKGLDAMTSASCGGGDCCCRTLLMANCPRRAVFEWLGKITRRFCG